MLRIFIGIGLFIAAIALFLTIIVIYASLKWLWVLFLLSASVVSGIISAIYASDPESRGEIIALRLMVTALLEIVMAICVAFYLWK
jgi:type VI protein secretion system component VasK